MKNKILYIRIFLWTTLVMVVFVLGWKKIIPTGQVIYVNDFTKDNIEFVGDLSPKERFEDVDGGRMIKANPVYFSVFTPRSFDSAKLSLKYKNINDERIDDRQNNIIEAGVLVDKKVWRYFLRPIENKIIDQLSLAWDVSTEDDILFLQREKKYSDLKEFKKNLPDLGEVALYNYDLKNEFLLSDYSTSSEELIVDAKLRGSYQFYTYIKNENLNFQFDILDINNNKDIDSVDLFLYYDNQIIASRHLDDDGVIDDNGEEMDSRIISLVEEGLPEGIYKIELKVNDDIVTASIRTKQSKLSFLNNLRLHKSGSENIDLFCDGKMLYSKTIHPSSLQVLKNNQHDLEIEKTFAQYEFNLERSTSTKYAKIEVINDGVSFASDGVFSFSENAMINPRIKKVDANVDINSERINYVIADYQKAEIKDGWKIAEVEFDISKAYRENGKYSFLISAPNLKLDDEFNNGILVDEVRVEFRGVSLIEKIRSKFNLK